jgi:hypothetical protein
MGEGTDETRGAELAPVEGERGIVGTIGDPGHLVPLVDPTQLDRADPVQQERWSVTLDALDPSEAATLFGALHAANLACHVQVVSPRFTQGASTFREGLYEVCVRKEDLTAAVALAKSALPGEPVPEGSIWGPSHIGEQPVVLCPADWEDAWDLAAQLVRAGIPAIVLPDDVATQPPPAHETMRGALRDEVMDEITSLGFPGINGREPGSPAVEDRAYEVVVEEPRLQEAAEIGRHVLGIDFHLDGSPYDA